MRVLVGQLDIPTYIRLGRASEELTLREKCEALWISFLARIARGEIFWR